MNAIYGYVFADVLTRICSRNKVGKMPANKHVCHASGIYREIMGNTGKYDLQPSTINLVISIIEVISLNISFLLVYQAIS